ncbi:putative TCT transport protein [Taylorella equigenitalis 14/56]|uniref:TCT transport protein n=2 Tax=Taylorella equigenitalis TaxID=29575 RepID=A0ABN4B1A0_9BURK|nr:tripartite tricarboxylate transporter TctB family protein [Taylorella equigenitalis]AFN36576.1 putative TCT transport protein [Taylorella equigenitalis ATCC 35865]ASY31143.1 tricarboxylate transporter [Taylorella equigenitalis]ASY39978.1 tripartite tricarboxylate transporter TctB family protein [Taylorella equigenitalis]CCG18139.1 putative TCT transport protein [Taylorella equigenitalis 14/56]VEG32742.1 Tripartite tricarboxylate transporter TctB family [Taylorella equigenitalis ATCC 35865]
MIIKNEQDFFSGLMFAGFGGFFSIYSYLNYDMGDAMHLGPGFFPFVLGVILGVIGAIIVLKSLCRSPSSETSLGPFDWDILILIIGSVLFFAFALEALGLILTIACICIMSSLASHDFQFKSAIGVAVFMAIFAWLVFVEGLGMTLPLQPSSPREWSWATCLFISVSMLICFALVVRRVRCDKP